MIDILLRKIDNRRYWNIVFKVVGFFRRIKLLVNFKFC